MANQYITTSRDDFEKATITKSYELTYKLPARRLKLSENAMVQIRHVVMNEAESLFIDVHFRSVEANTTGSSIKDAFATYPGEWAFLRDGTLNIITDKGTYNLEAHEQDSDVTTQNITNGSAVEEWCCYYIDKDILYDICESKDLRIQLKGARGNWELGGADFSILAKAFYNGFYDSSLYNQELEQAQRIADRQAKIKKRGCLAEVVLGIAFIIPFFTKAEVSEEPWNTILTIILVSIIVIAGVRRILAARVK